MIVTFLKTTIEELKELQTEIAYIERLQSLSTLRKDQPPVKIINFYSKCGYDWENDCDNAFLLILVLLEGVIKQLGIFIKNEWQVMNEEERIITLKVVSSKEADFVYAELVKEFQFAKARYSTLISPQITLEKFLNADNPKVIILDQAQKYIYEKIGNMFSCLHDLACIFYDIYENQSEGYIKLLHYMITHPARWRGKFVYALYRYYIELFLQTCGFFKEKKLQSELEKYPKLIEQVKSLKVKLKRTSDTHNFIIKALESDEKENEAENEQT